MTQRLVDSLLLLKVHVSEAFYQSGTASVEAPNVLDTHISFFKQTPFIIKRVVVVGAV
jgi:hypothetical protein